MDVKCWGQSSTLKISHSRWFTLSFYYLKVVRAPLNVTFTDVPLDKFKSWQSSSPLQASVNTPWLGIFQWSTSVLYVLYSPRHGSTHLSHLMSQVPFWEPHGGDGAAQLAMVTNHLATVVRWSPIQELTGLMAAEVKWSSIWWSHNTIGPSLNVKKELNYQRQYPGQGQNKVKLRPITCSVIVKYCGSCLI